MKKILTLFFLVFLATNSIWGQLSGTYYIGASGTKPGGGDPDYLSLKSACAALNTNGINGNITMYFTSDMVESGVVHLGVNTGGNSITFKPHSTLSACKITFNRATNPASTAVYGAWVIGNKDTTYQVPVSTDNIIIDGSVTTNGTTRDLTLECTGAASGIYPFRINGDNNNITIKNSNLLTMTGTGTYGIRVSGFRNTTAAVDSIPDNIIIENNLITNTGSTTGNPIAVDIASAPVTMPTGVIIRNNTINGRHRGIFLNGCGSIDIYNNEISLNQTTTGYLSYGIQPNNILAGSVINIYNNKLTKIATANITKGTYGAIGIYAGLAGTWNIYNNTLAGFASATATDPTIARIWGIQVATVTANIFYNTIYMPDLQYVVSLNNSPQLYTGFYLSSGTVSLKNNIVVSASVDSSYGIYNAGATLTSNYNNFYLPNGFVGYGASTLYQTIAGWQASAGTPDLNSKSVFVDFKSVTDLHLTSASDGDKNLMGTPLAEITKDIDGDTRDLNTPYMGADEANTPLPVELTSFIASAKGNVVELTWQTATEKNSSYFEVQRKSDKDSWTTIGKVSAAGTTTEKAKYSFTEKDVKGAVAYYRLKMVDLDGSYSYSKEVEAKVDLPLNFELSQNYPNPFNPSTTIKYAVPVDSKVRLEIYSMLGELVTTLVNDLQPAGNYTVAFDASRFASGTYIYRLTANNTVITKKMLLLK